MTPSQSKVSMLICATISLRWRVGAGVFRESWRIFRQSSRFLLPRITVSVCKKLGIVHSILIPPFLSLFSTFFNCAVGHSDFRQSSRFLLPRITVSVCKKLGIVHSILIPPFLSLFSTFFNCAVGHSEYAPALTSVNADVVAAGSFSRRCRIATIMPRVVVALGAKVVLLVPLIRPLSTTY